MQARTEFSSWWLKSKHHPHMERFLRGETVRVVKPAYNVAA